MYPTKEIKNIILLNILKEAAPKYLTEVVFTEGPASSALELAIRMTFLSKGSKEMQIATLGDAEHGNPHGNLLNLNNEETYGVNIKTVKLPFPTLKYSMKYDPMTSANEEQQCLEEIKKVLKNSVAAMIVSPMQVF